MDNKIDLWVARRLQSCRLQRKPLADSETTLTVIEKVALSLSDQHLLLCLALLTAGTGRLCMVSCYDFLIIDNLAWVSTMTHAISLSVLAQYFRSHRSSLRHLRLVLMTIILLWMIAFEFLGAHHDLWTYCIPMMCSISQIKDHIYGQSLYWLVSDISLLFLAYIIGVCAMYEAGEKFVAHEVFGNPRRTLERKEEEADEDLRLLRASRPYSVTAHGALWDPSMLLEMFVLSRSLLFTTLRFILRCVELLYDSIARQAFFNVCWYVYSVFWIIFIRSRSPTIMEGNQDEMGFGQIVPIVLLLATFFVWREASAGK